MAEGQLRVDSRDRRLQRLEPEVPDDDDVLHDAVVILGVGRTEDHEM